jgi:hypothetical protein
VNKRQRKKAKKKAFGKAITLEFRRMLKHMRQYFGKLTSEMLEGKISK